MTGKFTIEDFARNGTFYLQRDMTGHSVIWVGMGDTPDTYITGTATVYTAKARHCQNRDSESAARKWAAEQGIVFEPERLAAERAAREAELDALMA